MDCLEFQSLIGIRVNETEKKLTPVSSDVFVSIPNRDSIPSSLNRDKAPSYLSLACHTRHEVMTYLTCQISLNLMIDSSYRFG